MDQDVYARLREFLDGLPAGYPSTPTGVEIKILKKLFTPEEAELTMMLENEPEEVQSIAARTGRDEAELAETLEAMAQKGIIFRVRQGEQRLYQSFQFLVGIYEFQLKDLDREFCELFEEYLPYFGLSMLPVKTPQLRVIPMESSVESAAAVAPYNRIRDLVRKQEVISVQQCICRKEQGLLGKPCDRPQEVCIGFGNFAQFYLDNGMGRQISVDETFEILDQAESSGLVLSPTNSQEIEAICCCCPCCCPNLKYAKVSPRPADAVLHYYEATIEAEECTSCELCVDRCQMAAIEETDEAHRVIDGRCIGCGLCVAECPTDAISMVPRQGLEPPPVDFQETFDRIGAERGV